MEIIFYRKGYANNSSSSHALVFVDDKTKIETQDHDVQSGFQWNMFVASSKQAKLKYLMCSIYAWFGHTYQRRYGTYRDPGFITKEMINDFEASLFEAYIKKYNLDVFFNSLGKGVVLSIIDDEYGMCGVDHQSLLSLPLNRTGKDIHIGFMKSFFSEIIENNYIILGGNDNGDDAGNEVRGENNPIYEKKLDKKDDIIKLTEFIKDIQCEVLCVYDKKCDHFVLSRMDGPIMMVKFDRNFES